MANKLTVAQPKGFLRKLKTVYTKRSGGRQNDNDNGSAAPSPSSSKRSFTASLCRARERSIEGFPHRTRRPSRMSETLRDSDPSQRIINIERDVAEIKSLLQQVVTATCYSPDSSPAPRTQSVGIQAGVNAPRAVGAVTSQSPLPLNTHRTATGRSISLGTSTSNLNDGNTSYDSTDHTPDLSVDRGTNISSSASSMCNNDMLLANAFSATDLTWARTAGMHAHGYLGKPDRALTTEFEEVAAQVSLCKPAAAHCSSDGAQLDADARSDMLSEATVPEPTAPALHSPHAVDEILDVMRNAPEHRPASLNRRPSYETIYLIDSREKHRRRIECSSRRRSKEAEDLEARNGHVCVHRPTIVDHYFQRAAYHLLPVSVVFYPRRAEPKYMRLWEVQLPFDPLPEEPLPPYDATTPLSTPYIPPDSCLVDWTTQFAVFNNSPPMSDEHREEIWATIRRPGAGQCMANYNTNGCDVVPMPKPKRPINFREIYLEAGCDDAPPLLNIAAMISREKELSHILPLTAAKFEIDPEKSYTPTTLLQNSIVTLAFSKQSDEHKASGKLCEAMALVEAEQFVRQAMQKELDSGTHLPPQPSAHPLHHATAGAPALPQPAECRVQPAFDLPAELLDPVTGLPVDPGSTPTPSPCLPPLGDCPSHIGEGLWRAIND
ncbi:hypothetical protein HDZ31DRAFT_45639 [Schizophyllum fasciatum]